MPLLDSIAQIRTGTPLPAFANAVGGDGGVPPLERDPSSPDRLVEFVRFPSIDTKVFVDRALGVVTGLVHGPGFPGDVCGIKIGMHGREVASTLGRPDRAWPMPHPNIVMLYDNPEFLRVDVDRQTERVVAILR